jgi:hypothetical protein
VILRVGGDGFKGFAGGVLGHRHQRILSGCSLSR